jgi:hypothetical protein
MSLALEGNAMTTAALDLDTFPVPSHPIARFLQLVAG